MTFLASALTGIAALYKLPDVMVAVVAGRIREKLERALAPERLAITDESHRHHGHAGSRPEGETHFKVEIVAAAFRGQSRIARQREVYRILAEELAGPVHALQLVTVAPDEYHGG